MFNTDQQKVTLRALNYLLANADLTRNEHETAETAQDFIRDVSNGEIILDIWTTEDVKNLVDEDDEADGIAPVTDEEARQVLKQADDNHDASIGVNWDVLQANLDIVREEAKQKT